MKNLKYIFILALLTAACNTSKDKTIIKGDVSEYPDDMKISLYNYYSGNALDSTAISEGSFLFNVSLDKPQMLALKSETSQRFESSMKIFWANPGENIVIKDTSGKLSEATVSGSLHQKRADLYNKELVNFLKKQDSIRKIIENEEYTDNAHYVALVDNYYELQDSMDLIAQDFIAMNPDALHSAYLLSRQRSKLDISETDSLYSRLTDDVKESDYGKFVKRYLDITNELDSGDAVVDFKLANIDGDSVSYSDYGDKFVLIDFWASWCGPCRREMPYLKEAYSEYKDKGFEIIGVSLDDSKEDWLQAIEEDTLTWVHVIDEEAFKSDIAMTYDVRFIPTNYLINPEGVIIGKNLRGNEVIEKLEQEL